MKIILFIFILFIVSCNKKNTPIVIDINSKLIFKIMIKDSYYPDKDIIINAKIINNSQDNIYIPNINISCRLYKRDGEIFYPIEPVVTIKERYISPKNKINLNPILLKPNEFKEFSCKYYAYTSNYEEYEVRNLYPIKSGVYKLYLRYSNGTYKIDKKVTSININKEIMFRIKKEYNLFMVFFIVIGLLLCLYLVIKIVKKECLKKLLNCL